uniref:Uncharacterized protein n=1 Tax=Fundidesulfovibrio putealis TaxID=270496 RepID=A0A7C4AGD0_9BACT
MDPSALIPPADAIPAAPWLFRGLMDLTFWLHLLVMNAMLGLTLLGFARSLRGGLGLGHQAGLVPTAAALAVNLGVAPLLFVQVLYGQFLYVSIALMGVYWIALVLAVMAGYGLAYRQKYVQHAGQGRGTLLWAAMSALFLFASLVQTHNAVLMVRPDLWAGYFDNPSGTLTAWSDPTLIPRWLHFVPAAVALGGLSLAMTGRRRTRHQDPHGEELTAEGMRWFSWATLFQACTGLWWLAMLPRPVLAAFMGGDMAATVLLLAGVTGAGMVLAFGFMGRLMPAAVSVVLLVAVMVVLRDVLRVHYLAPHFDTASLPVMQEPSSLAMFLACLAVSVAVVVWAARHPVKDPKGA